MLERELLQLPSSSSFASSHRVLTSQEPYGVRKDLFWSGILFACLSCGYLKPVMLLRIGNVSSSTSMAGLPLQSYRATIDFPTLPLLCTFPYDVEPLRISESPASKTAIVEQRYSFPHAVPSSICCTISHMTLQSPLKASSLGLIFFVLTLLPAKW